MLKLAGALRRYAWLMRKGWRCLREHGFRYTWIRVTDKLRRQKGYSALALRRLYTPEELSAQREHRFPREIKFSIAVPLYNTPETFLREMVRSVLDQTYGDWELCLADGSDAEHADVEALCRQYAREDGRVRYRKLDRNGGISANTNACIDMATGDYIGLLDHDDILHPAALYEVMGAICGQDADLVYTDEATFEGPGVKRIVGTHFKPDYAADDLRANNYICHFTVFSRTLLERAGRFRPAYDGSQDHDMILRLTERAEHIVHIPKLLYYWRSYPQSVAQDIAAKEYAVEAGKNAVHDAIRRAGYEAEVTSSRAFPTIYRLRYELRRRGRVSIIIPSRDHGADLRRCVGSILDKTTYDDYEIVIVDNGSHEPDALAYYGELAGEPRVRIFSLDIPFNYSRLNNFGAERATGPYHLFLNNDTEVITPGWIEEMLMYVQRDDVAAAGAMLYFPNGTIQHAGIVLGMGEDRVAAHPYYRALRGSVGYVGRLCYARDVAAVTGACMLVKAESFRAVGGFDESMPVAYNDVDLCMRLRKAGQLIVWTPHAELYHYESRSRGRDDTAEKRRRLREDAERFRARWSAELAAGDPYYNPNLSLDGGGYSLK